MSEEEKRRLLAAVRQTSEESRVATERAQAAMKRAAKERANAVQEALDAGLPRQEIAEAAGTHKNILYRIIGKTKR